ncbi:MAG: hypothetical protein IKB97_06630 [Bacteroidaceae bacterium]|nr:hypothetical protein [Bacteroidaceae bacterium]
MLTGSNLLAVSKIGPVVHPSLPVLLPLSRTSVTARLTPSLNLQTVNVG